MKVVGISTPQCLCCNGLGAVESIEGEQRPCSRCNIAAFHRWADARRPKSVPAKSEAVR